MKILSFLAVFGQLWLEKENFEKEENFLLQTENEEMDKMNDDQFPFSEWRESRFINRIWNGKVVVQIVCLKSITLTTKSAFWFIDYCCCLSNTSWTVNKCILIIHEPVIKFIFTWFANKKWNCFSVNNFVLYKCLCSISLQPEGLFFAVCWPSKTTIMLMNGHSFCK